MESRILLVDDHTMFRKGLKHLIEESSSRYIVSEASCGYELMEKLIATDYELIILDLSLPGKDGLELLEDIKKSKPNIPVLILTMHPEEQYAVRVLKAGAAGYLTKSNDPEELLNAINKILTRGKYINASVAEKLADYIDNEITNPEVDNLSTREYQVMHGIAQGKSPSMIAAELYLSTKTVNTYRSRLMQKMQLRNNADIVKYAIKHRLIEV